MFALLASEKFHGKMEKFLFDISRFNLDDDKMDVLERAERVVAKLTEEDRCKLRQCIDECLSVAIMFDETGKPEYFAIMKNAIEEFMKTLRVLEKED